MRFFWKQIFVFCFTAVFFFIFLTSFSCCSVMIWDKKKKKKERNKIPGYFHSFFLALGNLFLLTPNFLCCYSCLSLLSMELLGPYVEWNACLKMLGHEIWSWMMTHDTQCQNAKACAVTMSCTKLHIDWALLTIYFFLSVHLKSYDYVD